MTPFEISVIALLSTIAVEVVWVGMRQDTKLFHIHDKIGLMFGFINRIGRSDPKISKIEKNTSGILDLVGKMHSNTCANIAEEAVDKMYPIEEGEPLDKPLASRDELVVKYVDILAGHVNIFHNPKALELTGTFVNAMADLGWLDIISRYEPKAEAVQ